MAKQITRIVLTGGPAAGKTTLISRILKEFKQDEGWKVITIPETATELISGFGIKPFGGCVSMLDFQDFVVSDQLHKEQLALKAAQMVPEEHVIVLYDRALFDDKAYISDEEFRQVLARFGLTEQQALSHYDTVLHLVSCAKGAEFAYNFGNEARYEPLELAREKDDLTLRAWRAHPNLHVIDNSVDFEDKIARGLRAVYEALGRPTQQEVWHKYLIALPTLQTLEQTYHAASIDADLSDPRQPQHRPPRPPAEKRRRLSLFLHGKAHDRLRPVGDGEADLRKGIHPLSHGRRHEPAHRPQDEVPLRI